ncbi:MAG: hypothetical protein KI790_12770 [Cyclobacteriaceae bacterium]|nr:hypothetical protein [Cyclobacteriaceae bacterium HetDA_MAG_MS6]
MKTIVTVFLLSFTILNTQAQNILLVDNTPGAPSGAHVYNDLQTAINAAVAGDILHVKPSNLTYGSVTITEANDSITLFGGGFNPDKEIFLRSTLSRLDIDGSNIRISGLTIEGILDIGDNTTSTDVANIQIDNSLIHYTRIAFGTGESVSDVVFRNCVISGIGSRPIEMDGDAGNIVFTNSILVYNSVSTSFGGITATNGTLFNHCLFLRSGGDVKAFQDINSSSISNCIFYGAAPSAEGTNANNTFNNNLFVNGTDTTVTVGTGNSYSGNLTESNLAGATFADANIVFATAWDFSWNPAPDPTSTQIIGGGNDATDIGLTGGSIPYQITGTSLPYIRQFIVPSVIRQGDNLPVDIRAVGN